MECWAHAYQWESPSEVKDGLRNTKEYFGEHQIPWQMLVATRIYFLLLVAQIASVAFCFWTISEEKVTAKWFANRNCISQITSFHKLVQTLNLDPATRPASISSCTFTNPTRRRLPRLPVKTRRRLFDALTLTSFPLDFDSIHWQQRCLSRRCGFSGLVAQQHLHCWLMLAMPSISISWTFLPVNMRMSLE